MSAASVMLQVASRVVRETFDDEVIIINLDSGSYYSLDEVGARIWGLLEEGATEQRIAQRMALAYDGDHDDIHAAVRALLCQLRAEALIVDGGLAFPMPERAADAAPALTRPRFTAPSLSVYIDMQDLLLLDPIHEVDAVGWPVRPEETGGLEREA